jgi:hypothetical protein
MRDDIVDWRSRRELNGFSLVFMPAAWLHWAFNPDPISAVDVGDAPKPLHATVEDIPRSGTGGFQECVILAVQTIPSVSAANRRIAALDRREDRLLQSLYLSYGDGFEWSILDKETSSVDTIGRRDVHDTVAQEKRDIHGRIPQ